MAIKTRNELKVFFQTAKKPTQQQFYDWLDSFIHKNDGVAIVDVAGLTAALNAKLDKATFDAYEQGQLIAYNADATYTIGAGYLLEKIIPYYGSDSYMRLSKVAYGAEDVMPEKSDVLTGWNNPIDVNILAVADTDLFISGIPVGSKISFIKRKIKLV